MEIKNKNEKIIVGRDDCFNMIDLFDICREEKISLENANLKGARFIEVSGVSLLEAN